MKTIVITGANRGIGLELVKTFSNDNLIYALCRGEFPDADLNDRIKVIKLDVTDEKAIKDFAKKLENEKVSVDLLINNAGIAGGDEAENVKVDAKSVAEVFATNTIGPMMMSLHLTPHLKKADHPVMIAISSRMGTHAMLNDYNAEWWPYSASKAALSLAVSAFAINEPTIKSISVHPGWVKTSMGGEEADIEPTVSAEGIKKLHETIETLESGKMYKYDGTIMAW
jgi:NAD(P)-dependent dehydrogenase (short-subunit alcohol dehydrogenase family)